MKTPSFWNQLLTQSALKRGWHLSRSELYLDFAQDLFAANVFAIDLGDSIQEILNRLRTGSYLPSRISRVEVPKGNLGFRPGTVPPLQDRVLLYSIVAVVAERLDSLLSDSVFSFRTRKPVEEKGPIFAEGKIEDIPFLKGTTIRAYLDPFIPWYVFWPKFDRRSQKAIFEDKYRFMATSDIAAYFENIQLPLLRDRLVDTLPGERRLINLLMTVLEQWAPKTRDGRPYLRGLPQGSGVFGFLANIFLVPLDNELRAHADSSGSLYLRYMDDVRFFSNSERETRQAIFLLERTLRGLHLNVQTAKTRILDERRSEAKAYMYDQRVEKLTALSQSLRDLIRKKLLTDSTRESALQALHEIAREPADSPTGSPIIAARGPLTGLSLRAFRLWIGVSLILGSHEFVGRLIREVQLTPDYRLTRRLVSAAQAFPKKRSIETKVMLFLRSDLNTFPHQEAELLRALRYLSRLHSSTLGYAWKKLLDQDADEYVRVQSAYLLFRKELALDELSALRELFERETSSYVQSAIAGLLVQTRADNRLVVRRLVLHPNNRIRQLGKLFRCVKNDPKEASKLLERAFNAQAPYLLSDSIPYLFLMQSSIEVEVRQRLAAKLRQTRRTTHLLDMRPILDQMYLRLINSLTGS